MELKIIELTDKNGILKTYDIYKSCMFMPTEEKFNKKADTFLADDSIKIFACLYENETKGIIVISFTEQYKIKIIGIAVDSSARNLGIGSYMINKLTTDYGLRSVYAETDNDAVGFYRKNGFAITEFRENYDGKTVVRYKCELQIKEFDNGNFQKYKAEVQEKWGKTDAYKEHSEKTKTYSKDKWNNLADGLDNIMAEFAVCMKNAKSPDSTEAKKLVKQLQNFITENYYTCTNEILTGLGQMYVADERFKTNIDKHADGTARFICEAITTYCKNK